MTSFIFVPKMDAGTIYLMIALLLGIFMPTTLFFGYKMCKRRLNITISKRYPAITFITAICFAARLISSSLLLIFLVTSTISLTDSMYKKLLIIDNTLLYLFLTLLIWRMWNINCDLQWINQIIKDEQWRTLISSETDLTLIGHKTSCYLRITRTWGLSSFCGKLLIPLSIIIYFCSVNIPILFLDDFQYDLSIAASISRATFIITILILLILFIITPKKIAGKRDGFYIISELSIIFVFNIFIFLAAVGAVVYGRFFNESFSDFTKRHVYILAEESLYFALEWLVVMFSTFFVLGKTGQMLHKYHLGRNRGATQKKMIHMDKNIPTQLYRALQKQEVFDAFLQHVAAEFSLQTLLALIEFVQFQRYCQKYFLKNPIAYQTLLPEEESLSLESAQIRLPDDLPQSDIVYLNAETEVKLGLDDFFGRTQSKAYNLYEKYIEPGCELPVPFSHNTRQKYVDNMKDLSVWLFESDEVKNLYDMMHWADRSIKDIYQLLSASYNTFHGKVDHDMLLAINDT